MIVDKNNISTFSKSCNKAAKTIRAYSIRIFNEGANVPYFANCWIFARRLISNASALCTNPFLKNEVAGPSVAQLAIN